MTSLRALALTCSLKPSPAPSSSQLIAQQVLDELATHGVKGDSVRVVDHDVRPGVETDMGGGDEWPALRRKVLAADTFQALNDIGFSIPAGGSTYWNGEAMQPTDYNDLDETPEAVAETTRKLAANAAHLAALLKERQYPPVA